jgi:hypothetical protein
MVSGRAKPTKASKNGVTQQTPTIASEPHNPVLQHRSAADFVPDLKKPKFISVFAFPYRNSIEALDFLLCQGRLL